MEITLFNKSGKPVAYIANDRETIYLWDGHAVAYLSNDNVYGWNGKHLGWFVNKIVYDLHGFKVGFTREKCPVATYAEPAKYAKYAKYAKFARYAAFARPALSLGYSEKDLRKFLE